MTDTQQWIALLTLIVGFVYTSWREHRNRQWDKQDRAELALKVVTVAQAVSDKVEVENAKLADAISIGHAKADQLTVATAKIEEQTNGGFTHLKHQLATAESRIVDLRQEITALNAEVSKLTKGAV